MGAIVSKHIREAARGEHCTLNIAGVCSYDPQTVVLAHLPDESKGLACKADDISSCFACHACHDVIDGRSHVRLPAEEREWYMRRAMVRSWRLLLGRGVISIKGVK